MNNAKKNNHSTKNPAGMKTGGASSCHALGKFFFGASDRDLNQGACGMGPESPNRSSDSGVTPLVAMEQSISMGLKARCMEVLMMVMASATFVLPCEVMFPKMSFLNRTEFLICCSAKLFVGLMTGYFRNTKSSFLKVISRLRILSDSWCDSGEYRYSLRTISVSVRILFFLPAHGDFPNINKIATSKHKETHPALETAGRSGRYLYNRMMGSFCQ